MMIQLNWKTNGQSGLGTKNSGRYSSKGMNFNKTKISYF